MREVKVVPYDPTWPKKFREEAETLRQLMSDEIIDIHHIGSTSIPNMSAKPIIDLLIEVKEIHKIDEYTKRLSSYGYLAFGENGIPGRRYFIKGSKTIRTHHIHMFQKGNREINRHIAFRDYLSTHHPEALQYATLKMQLAKQHPMNIEKYIQGKLNLIQEINQKAANWADNR